MIPINTPAPYRNGINVLKSELDRLLLTSVGFSCLLLLARIVHTGRHTFVFLLWNLFLAFVPYFFSFLMTQRPAWIKSGWKFALGFTAWVLFVPNAFYVLTDLFHLFDSGAAPLWYDLLLIVSFAWNALIMGILSVRQMEKIVTARWPGLRGWAFLYPVMALNGLGVYIGRYLRYNSWDVITDPFGLTRDIVHIVFHPLLYRGAWEMIGCFAVFLVILYTTIKKISHALH
jgi:uncharacterized membrane protein